MRSSSRFKLASAFSLIVVMMASLAWLLSTRLPLHAASTYPKHALTLATASSTHSTSCGAWSVVPSANAHSRANSLNAVSAVSATNVWAVGYSENTTSQTDSTLIEHWNGKKWSIIASPHPGKNSLLTGVAAISTTDVWAVGYYYNSTSMSLSSGTYPLIEQWNGKKWSEVSTPNLPSGYNFLYAVAAIPGTGELWAVGTSEINNGSNSSYQTLIEQWNGTSWNIIPGPNAASSSLDAIIANNANDAWTVGDYINNNQEVPLVEHWDGTSWSINASSSPGDPTSLSGVVQVPGTNQLVAVGSALIGDGTPDSGGEYTVIEQWNGTSWNIIRSPNAGPPADGYYNYLNGVTAISANNVWAVGDYNLFGQGFIQTLIEHWDGTSWSIVASPNPGSGDNFLNGMTLVPGTGELWVVGGSRSPTGSSQTALTEFYC